MLLSARTQRPLASGRQCKAMPITVLKPVGRSAVHAKADAQVIRKGMVSSIPARSSVVVYSGAADATATTTEGLMELNKDTFYPYLESPDNKDTLVVVDFFTDWCGPCKVIYPELVKYAKEHPELRIVKFNCNKANKELGVKLAIKVAPTFHLYKNAVKVGEMTGAKFESLVALIEKNK